ncbi:MAG TPA: hypothetical protein VGG58_00385 [Candidatus Acidoferrum sp.]
MAACALNVPDVALHVTPAPPTSFVTVAVNPADWFSTNPITLGEIVTLTRLAGALAVIVIIADADFVPSVTDVAVSVTVAGLGTVAGAVYVTAVPDAPVVADSKPQPFAVAHDNAHVTPFAALSFVKVGVNFCVPPVITEAVVGATVTPITGVGVIPPPPFEPLLDVDPPPQPANSPLPTTAPAANTN